MKISDQKDWHCEESSLEIRGAYLLPTVDFDDKESFKSWLIKTINQKPGDILSESNNEELIIERNIYCFL